MPSASKLRILVGKLTAQGIVPATDLAVLGQCLAAHNAFTNTVDRDFMKSTALSRFALLAVACFGTGTLVRTSAAETITIADSQVLSIHNAVIASPIAGLVRQCRVHEGDAIGANQVLIELDDTRATEELAAAYAAHEAALIQANNDVNIRYAQRTLEVRRRELMQSIEANERYSGSVTKTEIDRLQLVIDQAELSVEQAKQERSVAEATVNEKAAAVNLGQLRVNEHSIESMIAGRIAEVSVQAGQWIEAGAPVVRILSLDPIRISGFIDGRVYNRSLVGRPVTFHQTPSAESDSENTIEPMKLSGHVSFVSDELNPITSQVRLWAEVANPDEVIRPGMRGRLVIEE